MTGWAGCPAWAATNRISSTYGRRSLRIAGSSVATDSGSSIGSPSRDGAGAVLINGDAVVSGQQSPYRQNGFMRSFLPNHMDIIVLLFGREQTSENVFGTAVLATLIASLLIVFRTDIVFPLVRYLLWAGLVVLSLGLAVYAGKNRGGILAAWASVFLAVIWLYVVPPLIAHLQGDEFGDREYAVLRPSVVGLDPYSELMTGLQIGPVIALLVAVTAGSIAFGVGLRSYRYSSRFPDAE